MPSIEEVSDSELNAEIKSDHSSEVQNTRNTVTIFWTGNVQGVIVNKMNCAYNYHLNSPK